MCVEQYEKYEVEPGTHVIGKLTLGENIADIGGLRQSYDAYKAWEQRHGSAGPSVGKLTPEQLFFVAHGQVWCTLMTPEQMRLRITTDPQSPDSSAWWTIQPSALPRSSPARRAIRWCVNKCEVW